MSDLDTISDANPNSNEEEGGFFASLFSCCGAKRSNENPAKKGEKGTEPTPPAPSTPVIVKKAGPMMLVTTDPSRKNNPTAKGSKSRTGGHYSAEAHAIFALLDLDGSGKIEKKEFLARLKTEEQLAQVFFSYSKYRGSKYNKPKSGNWSELAIKNNIKKIFDQIDTTTDNDTRNKRELTIREIHDWCENTGAKLA